MAPAYSTARLIKTQTFTTETGHHHTKPVMNTPQAGTPLMTVGLNERLKAPAPPAVGPLALTIMLPMILKLLTLAPPIFTPSHPRVHCLTHPATIRLALS